MSHKIKVVLFFGPYLSWDIKVFISKLIDNSEIEFVAALCQGKESTLWGQFKEGWRRRRFLVFPIFAQRVAVAISRLLLHPCDTASVNRRLRQAKSCIEYVENIHSKDVLKGVEAVKPELGLVYGAPILKPVLFEIPGQGTLGIHHGKVPEYRGVKTTFWSIYNGEEFAGVTIQRIGARLDAGDVVHSGLVPIGHKPRRRIWREVEDLGFELYIQSILDIKSGQASFKEQDLSTGTIYKNPTIKDLFVCWTRRFCLLALLLFRGE